MREMCKHEDGIMPLRDLQKLPACGSDVMEALICYNVVHTRAKSILARDLSWYTRCDSNFTSSFSCHEESGHLMGAMPLEDVQKLSAP